MCLRCLTKNDEGAESKEEDEEEQHAHGHGLPRGWSRTVHLPRQPQSDPQRVVAWSYELLQTAGQPALGLFCLDARCHVDGAVVRVAGSVRRFVRFTYQHLVVAQGRQVFGPAGVGGRATVFIRLTGGRAGILLALGQHAFLPFALALLLGEEVDEAVDVPLRLVSQQEDTQAHLQTGKLKVWKPTEPLAQKTRFVSV